MVVKSTSLCITVNFYANNPRRDRSVSYTHLDVRPLVRLSVSVLVEEDGKRERGSSGGGGRFGYDYFLASQEGEVRADAWAKEAVRMALVNLSAVAAPAGMLPVVLGAGWPGVLLHEAVGHGLEGDFNRRGTSVFSGHMGELVASELCTVVDDGTIVDRRGSVAIDDEGTPGQYNVLIENGILKGYMQDKLNARLMGVAPTGNGRRESYAHLPMPRMTNTYLLAGQSTPQEIIESVDYGIFAPNFEMCIRDRVQAGLTLVGTSWIKQLDAELIKLHPGLARNIEKRSENQLLVQSLVEACKGMPMQVLRRAYAAAASGWYCPNAVSRAGRGNFLPPHSHLTQM